MNYVIVGLGNPGDEYEKTRHNVGRRLVESMSDDWKNDKMLSALVSNTEIAGKKAKLVLPETFMNRSGSAVRPLAPVKKTEAKKIVVCHDDIDLPVGRLKISFDRGSAGHKGVESIKRALGTTGFVRLRIGIAPTTPSGKIKKTEAGQVVLKNLTTNEEKKLSEVFKKGKEAIEAVVLLGHERAMNLFN